MVINDKKIRGQSGDKMRGRNCVSTQYNQLPQIEIRNSALLNTSIYTYGMLEVPCHVKDHENVLNIKFFFDNSHTETRP
jgi:hypothetical protein